MYARYMQHLYVSRENSAIHANEESLRSVPGASNEVSCTHRKGQGCNCHVCVHRERWTNWTGRSLSPAAQLTGSARASPSGCNTNTQCSPFTKFLQVLQTGRATTAFPVSPFTTSTVPSRPVPPRQKTFCFHYLSVDKTNNQPHMCAGYPITLCNLFYPLAMNVCNKSKFIHADNNITQKNSGNCDCLR